MSPVSLKESHGIHFDQIVVGFTFTSNECLSFQRGKWVKKSLVDSSDGLIK